MNSRIYLGKTKWAFAIGFILLLSGCDFSCSGFQSKAKTEDTSPQLSSNVSNLNSTHTGTGASTHLVPTFDENYAYEVTQKYESFGPKVSGSDANKKAGDWIVLELKKWGLSVLEQTGTGSTYEGKPIPIRNIIAQFNPEAKTRFLLSAHWDNRPNADEDNKDTDKPILGTNDGGSGVAVLLTISKALQNIKADFGIDLAFWDAEDLGNPKEAKSYCLGSQFWAKNPVPANYQAKFGINYDMVGRIGSLFPKENYSMQKAAFVYEKLEKAAKTLGFQDYFPNYTVGPITDDHYFVTEGRGIPMIDLIYMTEHGNFPPEWHTHADTLQFISRDVLKVVGQTTLQLIFTE